MVKRKSSDEDKDETKDTYEFVDGKKIYYKVMHKSLKHYDYQYKYGLNILSNTYPQHKYVSDIDNIVEWVYLHPNGKIHEIQVPDNAQITVHDKMYKVNQLILGPGLSINEFVKNHKLEKQFVTHEPLYLRYVDRQTPELCEQAINRNYSALFYVKRQTKKMCEFALKQNPRAILYITLGKENKKNVQRCLQY